MESIFRDQAASSNQTAPKKRNTVSTISSFQTQGLLDEDNAMQQE